MKKKALFKVLTAPIRPMKFDATELLLLVFVVVSLLVFFSWQQGLLSSDVSQMVLGVSSGR